MKITINTNDDFAVDITMDEADASKDNLEIAFEQPAVVSALCEALVNKFTNSCNDSEKKESIFRILGLAKDIVDTLYKENQEDHEEV